MSAKGITLMFGGVGALSAVDLSLKARQIGGLIGPNGAGKTSLLNCICRFYTPQSGEIRFAERNLLKVRPHQLAGIGIARTFQQLELFASMNVLENVIVGTHTAGRPRVIAEAIGWPSARRAFSRRRQIARETLELVHLSHRTNSSVTALPLGLQKRVSMARALACQPRLLLLDEPASGMNEVEKQELQSLLVELRDRLDLTILLIEHDMDLVMSLCEHLTVLDFGRTIASGSPAQVRRDPEVIGAYLGMPSRMAHSTATGSDAHA